MRHQVFLLAVLAALVSGSAVADLPMPKRPTEAGYIVGWGRQVVDSSLKNIQSISAGFDFSLALKSDGTIVAWGDNYFRQAVAPDGNDFVAVSAGNGHGLALKSDGSVVSWGRNDYEQANCPRSGYYVAIAGGLYHSIALRSDGYIVCWGSNDYGQITSPGGYGYMFLRSQLQGMGRRLRPGFDAFFEIAEYLFQA